MIHEETERYNEALDGEYREVAALLAREISRHLPEAENKIWHRHPVWFLEGNGGGLQPVEGMSATAVLERSHL